MRVGLCGACGEGQGWGAHPDLRLSPVGLRGFSVTSGGQTRIFKPISVQTMW